MEPLDMKAVQLFGNASAPSQNEDLITVRVPGSKSITNRILLIAALGQGTVRVSNFLKSADTIAMLGAMTKLQIATFKYDEDSTENVLIVNGNGGSSPATRTLKDNVLHVNNSGTAARFLTTLAVVMSGRYKQPIRVTGNEQIKKRPIDLLVDALAENGAAIEYEEGVGSLPLTVQNVNGFAGGHIKVDAQISSQYVSSILMCAPYANEPVTLELCGHVISRSYIDMTIALMKSFGILVTQIGANVYHIPKGIYRNPPEFVIEPDASTATYPMAVAAIMGRAVTIPHLGTTSIQGDAGFARDILHKMGCAVEITETCTTVRGPPIGSLNSLEHVDMEPLTDSFLTAACLAAVVKNGVSTITGIANQRVKECNRISAMVSQLAKFGVRAEELDDGLKIWGQDYTKLVTRGSVHCFDDHRVAMSFSLLGCLVPCIIRDRFCTKKTWPEWWDVLNNTLNVELSFIDVTQPVDWNKNSPGFASELTGSGKLPSSSGDKTIILVGMRGAGKTTIGRKMAKILSKHFVDMDEEFCRVYKSSANEYIKLHGWEAFRGLELHILVSLVNKYPTNCIIATGGGIVETEDARAVLQDLNSDAGSFTVVHVKRNLQKIVNDPSFQTKIAYDEDVNAVFERRKPWYEKLSSKEFYVTDSGNTVNLGPEFEEIFQQAALFTRKCYEGLAPNHWSKARTRTVSPTLPVFSILCVPSTEEAQNLAKTWTAELKKFFNLYSVIELRFAVPEAKIENDEEIQERLEEIGELFFLLKRISKLPVVLSCIAADDSFQTSHTSTFIEVLISSASKWHVDMLCFDEAINLQLSTRAKGIIANSELSMAALYQGPDADTVLSKTKYNIIETGNESSQLQGTLDQQHLDEIIHIGTRNPTQYLMPSTYTDADHLIAKLKAFNLRVAESQKAQVQPKQFYLFGSPIAKSKSPLLHNTGFDAVELPYTYHLYEAAQIESTEIESLMRDPKFGGASVTIPLKEKVGEFLDEITDAAAATGAINTIFINGAGKLVGDNTDYIGMLKVLQPALNAQGQDPQDQRLRGLIIGGGGTARAAVYAFLSVPQIMHITIVNRSVGKALALIEEFKQKPTTRQDVVLEADSLESLNCVCFDDLHHPHFIISTIPADAQKSCSFSRQLFRDTVAVVEMVYGIKTPLLHAVEDFNSKSQSSSPQVSIYTGAEVLIEQGLRQFEIWTGLTLPFEEMRAAVEKAFETENQ